MKTVKRVRGGVLLCYKRAVKRNERRRNREAVRKSWLAAQRNFLFPDVENADHKLFEKTWEVPLYDYDAWDNKLKKYLEFNDIVATAWQKDYSGPIYLPTS